MKIPELTDLQITETMRQKGGGFVSRLGDLWRHADSENQAKLKDAFAAYWQQYAAITQRCPECGRTDIIPDAFYYASEGYLRFVECLRCESCTHQWGHK